MELKGHCFSDKSMQEWLFENDKGLFRNTLLAKLYVKDWETEEIGRSFLVGCIANDFLD